MILVLLGPPGAGKGTQAVGLAESLGHVHLSTGDLFRKHLAERTTLGVEAEGYMKRGELVPDTTVIGMVRDRLGEADVAAGAVLDGFPRTVAQAKALDEMTTDLGFPPATALCIDVAPDEVIRRLSGRRVCRAAGHPYHLEFNPPRQAGVCDIDSSELYQRADDTEATVKHRLEVYEAETKPVIDYYAESGRLHSVPGTGGPAAVATRLSEAVRAIGR